jgi:hypothetical protein
MCRIDYAEDGQWLTPPHEVRARKEHRCEDCGRTIAKGEPYNVCSYLSEGDFGTTKMCVHCHAAGRWLRVVCGGHFYPGVLEELWEHWDEEYDLRSHGLGRLVLWGRRDWRRGDGDLVDLAVVDRWVDAALARVPASARP